MTAHTRGSGHDWDDARKAALFARIVGLELSIEEAAKLHGLRVDVIQEWLRSFRRSALLAFDERLKKTLIDQGANADALAAAEFTGHIEDVSIADLVQTIEIAGKDAVITVTHDGQDHRMWCSAGAIIDAQSGRLSGDAAVYRILGFDRGRMVADLRPEPRERTIYAATHRLLLEAMRRIDESAPLLARLGSVDQLYRLGERSTSARVHVSTDELSILKLFDSQRRVGDVLAQSQLGDFETLGALVRLVEHGYLIAAELSPRSSRAEAARSESGSRPSATPRESRAPRSLRAVRADDFFGEDFDGIGDSAPRSSSAARGEAARSGSASRGAEPSARADAKARAENAARAARAARPTQPRRESSPSRVSAVRPARKPRVLQPEREPAVGAPASERHAERQQGPARRERPAERHEERRAERYEVEEPPRSAPASFMPISVPRRPQERATLTPRWVFAAMAAAVLAPAAFWFGETMSNLQAARRARVRDAQALVAAAQPERFESVDPTPSFAVSTRVEPAAATIWLDHHPVASGQLEIVLPKDGHTHELRAAAEGYIPVTLLFADVAPPREIQLERLSPPREPALSIETSTPSASTPETGSAARAAVIARAPAPAIRAGVPVSAPIAVSTRTAAPRLDPVGPVVVAPRPRATPRPGELSDTLPELAFPDEPHVPAVNADAPKIQVIE